MARVGKMHLKLVNFVLFFLSIHIQYQLMEQIWFAGGLDLIIMPGVAFTKDGGRMGHGMGYYDKYLSNLFVAVPSRRDDKLRKRITEKLKENKTILIGLAFKEQICENIPLDPFDILLDGVITAE